MKCRRCGYAALPADAQLIEHLHYRIVDVSTVKELVRRWYAPARAYQREATGTAHRCVVPPIALTTARSTISAAPCAVRVRRNALLTSELAFYRASVFQPPG